MTVLLLAGTADEKSRCAALLDAAGEQLRARLDLRLLHLDRLHIRNLSPQALLLGDTAHPTVLRARQQLAAARALVVATPSVHGSYSGILKTWLDLLPADALRGKTVLPLGLAERSRDLNALADALDNVFGALDAEQVLPGVYALEHEIPLDAQHRHGVTDLLRARLDKGAQALVHALHQPGRPRFRPILIEPTRLSV